MRLIMPVAIYRRYSLMVNRLMQRTDNSPDHLLHAAIGMVGEVVELCQAEHRAEMLLELGDIFFYRESLISWFTKYHPSLLATEVNLASNYTPNIEQLYVDLVGHSVNIMDLAKKHWAYGQEASSTSIRLQLSWVDQLLAHFLDVFDFDLHSVLQANMDKLGKRYPDYNFSTEASASRKDEA